MKRKLFCIWMCIALLVTLMPSMAFADETAGGSTEPLDTEAGQLYWFYSGGIKVNSDGKITREVEDEDVNLNGIAYEEFNVEYRKSSCYGYFAVQDAKGDYYALKNVASSDNSKVSVAPTANEDDSPYRYKLTWSDFGEATITAEKGGKIYQLKFTAELPETGFYRTADRTTEGYLDGEFHYSTASKDEQGNVFFYLIAPTNGRTVAQLTLSAVKWNADKEQWAEDNIEGLFADKTPTMIGDNGKYVMWKITVAKNYRSPEDSENWQVFQINYEETLAAEDAVSERRGLSIYDSTEITEQQRLYWFYDSDEITVDKSGNIQLATSAGSTWEDVAYYGRIWENNKSGSCYGYFAVKDKEDTYHALKESVSGSGLLSIAPTADTTDSPYRYKLTWNQFGNATITATVGEKEYRIKFTAELPYSGFYRTETRSEATYLDGEFHYNAAQKDDQGNASFYLITEDWRMAESLELSIGELADDGTWKEKTVDGLSASKATNNKSEYAMWTITVTKDYRNPTHDRQNFRIYCIQTTDDGSSSPQKTLWDEAELRIYDSTESTGSDGGGYVTPVNTPEKTAKDFIKKNLTINDAVVKAADAANYTKILDAAEKYDKLSTAEKAAVDKEMKAQTGKTMAELKTEAETMKASVGTSTFDVQKAVKELTLKARSTKLKSGKIKITLKADLSELKKNGYTVKYKFYRSTKKAKGYKATVTKSVPTYLNTVGKKGTMYYYKVRVLVYDKDGKLVAKSGLKQCGYANRKWTK